MYATLPITLNLITNIKAMKTIYLLIFGLFLLLACSEKEAVKEELIVFENEKLIGNWTNPVIVDTLVKYERVNELKKDEYGFSFMNDQKFLERKNVGWCGTPPITYGDHNGTWSRNNSEINVTVDSWDGTVVYKWQIISLDDKYLTVYQRQYRN